MLRVSLDCKVFLDHPQNYRVCWRGSCPSLVRVSDKQNIQNKPEKTRVRQNRLDWFRGWSKVSRCKKKDQKKTENYTKRNKGSNLDHLFPGNDARKRGLLTLYNRIKLQIDLQSGQVSRHSQGTLLPSSGEYKVSNPWNKCVMQELI
jgi:hypothetical protein